MAEHRSTLKNCQNTHYPRFTFISKIKHPHNEVSFLLCCKHQFPRVYIRIKTKRKPKPPDKIMKKVILKDPPQLIDMKKLLSSVISRDWLNAVTSRGTSGSGLSTRNQLNARRRGRDFFFGAPFCGPSGGRRRCKRRK